MFTFTKYFELLHQCKGNVINYFVLCSCVLVVLSFVDFYMLINHLLEKKCYKCFKIVTTSK